jgi:hypothetical protein
LEGRLREEPVNVIGSSLQVLVYSKDSDERVSGHGIRTNGPACGTNHEPSATVESWAWARRSRFAAASRQKPRNLPLAAQRCVGHIGRTGDVAEWLKAAVC